MKPIPLAFRERVIDIWEEYIGGWYVDERTGHGDLQNRTWETIHDYFAGEQGQFNLSDKGYSGYEKLCHYFLDEATERKQVVFIMNVIFGSLIYEKKFFHCSNPDEAVEKFNRLVDEYHLGFQWVKQALIDTDAWETGEG